MRDEEKNQCFIKRPGVSRTVDIYVVNVVIVHNKGFLCRRSDSRCHNTTYQHKVHSWPPEHQQSGLQNPQWEYNRRGKYPVTECDVQMKTQTWACFLCHQPDLPVCVSRGESHGGFRPGQDRDQKLFPGERDGQLHHSVYPKSKPGHKQCVHSSSAVPDEQLDIHSRSKQHKSKWYVSLYCLF